MIQHEDREGVLKYFAGNQDAHNFGCAFCESSPALVLRRARVGDAIVLPSSPQAPFVQLKNQSFSPAADLSMPFVLGTELKTFSVVLRSRFRLVSLPGGSRHRLGWRCPA